jgi:hypothetical protein
VQRRRAPAIDNPERQRAQGGLKRGVVALLCPWQPLKPLPRSVGGEAAQIHGDDAVGGLGLSIGLGVKCREVQLGSGQFEELLPEVAREYWVTITHHRRGHAV